ncbi:Ing1 like PHD finger protein [Cryptosporidium ryanae]|uniref:Ing1 like PHD finger protein n=1 Tax=Cryptosporidium ryanae TaxID=515981 RepID=UPI00351A6B66|nr:Ing1 like PHD finger protein [Cryptosporidium ryanae]
MSDSSISSDESDWDSSWGCSRDFSDISRFGQEQHFPYIIHPDWLSPDQDKRESSYQGEYYSRENSRGFLNSVKTVPGNTVESDNEEVTHDFLDSSYNENVGFFDSQIPNCRSQGLQHNAKMCIEYLEDDVSRLMWALEQQFQECVLTKDSKRQRNHGFSVEEVSEIDSVEQKKYKLRVYIHIMRYFISMIEECASLELLWAKNELEMTNLLKSNISEAFMKLQKINLNCDPNNPENGKSNDSQKNTNSSKLRKSKRIQAKVLEEEVNTTQTNNQKVEVSDMHSIDDESLKYCFCKQPVLDNMIRCESGDDCIYGVWFHFLCLKIIEEPQKTWYCPGCTKNEDYRALWHHIFERESIKKPIENEETKNATIKKASEPLNDTSSNTKGEKKKLNIKKERKRSKSMDACPKKKQVRLSLNVERVDTDLQSKDDNTVNGMKKDGVFIPEISQ